MTVAAPEVDAADDDDNEDDGEDGAYRKTSTKPCAREKKIVSACRLSQTANWHGSLIGAANRLILTQLTD